MVFVKTSWDFTKLSPVSEFLNSKLCTNRKNRRTGFAEPAKDRKHISGNGSQKTPKKDKGTGNRFVGCRIMALNHLSPPCNQHVVIFITW